MFEYQSALSTRYGSKKMRAVFSDYCKYKHWRKCWIALAKAQKELGLLITDEQIQALEDNVNNIDLKLAATFESQFNHDVMAQLYAFGEQAPIAKGILHLGATSAFVSDNGEILMQKAAMDLIKEKLTIIIRRLAKQAELYADMPTVGFTHYQMAQPTTIGKRLALYLQDFVSDYEQLLEWQHTLKLRGAKGTTGTQASYLLLFDQDVDKVAKLDALIADYLGIDDTYLITSQTYPRKRDSQTLSLLSMIAQSAHKLAVDFRLMQHDGLVSEPFGSHQIGSSAMAYKRNPILCEKICGLSRKVMIDALNGPMTASNQWLERTLDDSSNRRLVIAEAFIIIDEILVSTQKVLEGMVIYPGKIRQQLQEYLPFLATEPILMAIANKGQDRQLWHEHIRQQSMLITQFQMDPWTLIENLQKIEGFPLTKEELDALLKPDQFIGLAAQQTHEYLKHIESIIKESNHD